MADEMGYGVNLGIEAEFFVLKDDEREGFKPLSDRRDLASRLMTCRGFSTIEVGSSSLSAR